MTYKKHDKLLSPTANDLLIDMHILAKEYDIYSINDFYKNLFVTMFPDDTKATQPANINEVFSKLEILAHSKDKSTAQFVEKITQELEKRKFSDYLTKLSKRKNLFYKSRAKYLSSKLIHSETKKPDNPMLNGIREFIACSTLLKSMEDFRNQNITIQYENMTGDVISTTIRLDDKSSITKRGPASFVDSFYIVDVQDIYTKARIEIPLNLIVELDHKVIDKLIEQGKD